VPVDSRGLALGVGNAVPTGCGFGLVELVVEEAEGVGLVGQAGVV
jgi:hypothetical protein